MSTHADRTRENKSQVAVNERSQISKGIYSASQFTDNRPESIAQRKLHEIANTSSVKLKPNVQSMVIQRHQLDNDVLETNSLEDIVTRIERIAQDIDINEPVQERINDLWIRQNTLLNDLRSNLELESAKDDSTKNVEALTKVVSSFSIRLTSASLSLFFKNIKLPKVEPYVSKIGQHLLGGGGGDISE
ncbi:MAG TPA: hypothetical protein DCR40_05945 [Prolixibacteraceae bacterium]|nr:hypothetical protein [Prolixibacteraceae bacterium]